jgi:signal transduction histidine kinase
LRSLRVLKTASFKLAAVYVLLFGTSVALLGAIIYFTATAALDRQERTRLQSEAEALRAEYRRDGFEELMEEIRARARSHVAGGFDYTVLNQSGARVFGNIPRFGLRVGWTRLKGPSDGDQSGGRRERLLVYSMRLSPNLWVEVGDDIDKEVMAGKAIMAESGWVLLVVVTLAIAGGVLLSASFLSRIDAITRTAEAIIEGDIGRRVPLRGVDDDIDRLAATLNRMLDQISSLLSALRQVSWNIAHDLRTPLGRLRQGLDEAQRTAVYPADYECAIERAIGETDQILQTFAALLRIAQIESGTRRAGFRRIDLSALVTQIGHSYVPVAEDAGKQLDISAVPDIAVEGDRELISQLLVNLVENSLRHTQDGAHVSITLERSSGVPLLAVSDDGPGIPEDERKRVLGRFYRLERSKTAEGFGLGLSLVAAVADLHRAKLTFVDRSPGLTVNLLFSVIDTNPAAESAPKTDTPTAIRGSQRTATRGVPEWLRLRIGAVASFLGLNRHAPSADDRRGV